MIYTYQLIVDEFKQWRRCWVLHEIMSRFAMNVILLMHILKHTITRKLCITLNYMQVTMEWISRDHNVIQFQFDRLNYMFVSTYADTIQLCQRLEISEFTRRENSLQMTSSKISNKIFLTLAALFRFVCVY